LRRSNAPITAPEHPRWTHMLRGGSLVTAIWRAARSAAQRPARTTGTFASEDDVERINVLLALRPLMFRQVLERAIQSDVRFQIVASMGNTRRQSVLKAAASRRPDIVVLNLLHPAGLPALGQNLLTADPDLTVLLISDRHAAALIYRGSPPATQGLLLHSIAHVLAVLAGAGRPLPGPDPATSP
jgi:hypothetical protein